MNIERNTYNFTLEIHGDGEMYLLPDYAHYLDKMYQIELVNGRFALSTASEDICDGDMVSAMKYIVEDLNNIKNYKEVKK